MNLIPVIDYKQGNVVLAKRGMREKYEPVNSLLCSSSDIHHVIETILALARFKTIYIADLDCIENQHTNISLWSSICNSYPSIEFWIDLGTSCAKWPSYMHNTPNARPVLGSESFQVMYDLEDHIKRLRRYRPIISIDIKEEIILGPKDLFASLTTWSSDIIVLSLTHVGSNNGPNTHAISLVKSSIKNARLHYGGGIRNKKDIEQIKQLNIDGILIASSIHNGEITKEHLENN